MKIIKSFDPDGTFTGVTIRASDREVRGASIEVLDPAETSVRLPRGWYLFQTSGRSEYQLLCRPTDTDVLAELSSVMRQVQEIRSSLIPDDPSWGDMIEDFRSLSFQDSPDAWREWATARMQDAERDVELAAQAIVEELGLESAQ
ncbi:hypothetical protein HW932_18575 [Allochromatium humboldtianum]|uniref:Uncharacterized protein n=1 Tax=Allochromatium humboldtianum TaxID=504901 RepID=A0A850R967_9GAMM|nr:hypothetical protein [Allochromatium humboldtianum]NVZ11259.1 hypothetical protein [Allochromatium humboldtianum]